MKIARPGLTGNIVQFSNSILENFHVPPFHPTLPKADALFNHSPRLVVVLFDGNGQALQRRHLGPLAFLRRNRVLTMDATFPPTTVASTTALLSGRYPIENGWLGWMQYFSAFDRNIDVFNNQDDVTRKVVAPGNLLREKAPYDDLMTLISKKNPTLHVDSLWPTIVAGGTADDLVDFFTQLEQKLDRPGPLFIYGYWADPDGLIHRNGVNSKKVRQCIREINRNVKALVKRHPDTTFAFLADHGLIDTTFLAYDEHEDFAATLKRCFSNESRAAFFFVKQGKEAEFEGLFQKYYGKYFRLIPKADILKEGWFGEGDVHPVVHEFLGDYMAVAIDRYAFDYRMNGKLAHGHFSAHHAGITEEEVKIDMAIIPAKTNN